MHPTKTMTKTSTIGNCRLSWRRQGWLLELLLVLQAKKPLATSHVPRQQQQQFQQLLLIRVRIPRRHSHLPLHGSSSSSSCGGSRCCRERQ